MTGRDRAPSERSDGRSIEHGDEERKLMAAWGITFHDGVYHFREHRYGRLADAVSYACLQRLHAGPL